MDKKKVIFYMIFSIIEINLHLKLVITGTTKLMIIIKICKCKKKMMKKKKSFEINDKIPRNNDSKGKYKEECIAISFMFPLRIYPLYFIHFPSHFKLNLINNDIKE